MKSIYITALSLGVVACVAGCGKKSSDESKAQADNNLKAKGNAAIQTASYTTDCSSANLDFAGVKFPGARTDYDLSDLGFTKKQFYFTDDCKTSAFFVQEKGQVAVIGNSGAIPGALEEDFKYEHTTVTLTNEALVKAFNLIKACGVSDWAVNVEKDVSNQADQALCPGKASPRIALEVVLVDNNTMLMGANTNQDATKGRPVQLDRTTVFKKQ